MNIEQQKQIAKNVYDKLKLADPDCLLAGGAPRDWYFGELCNDLDFYFCSTACTMGSTKRQLKAIGFENVKHIADPYTSELYKSMEGLLRIWECEYEGMKVQFIQLCTPQNRWKVVDNMDISICKAYCKQNDMSIVLHQDFKLTVASRVMFLKEGYDWEQKHAMKMFERFKGKFAAGTKEQATDHLIRVSLEGIQ